MEISGESLPHVFGANELLEFGNHPDYKNKKVIVIGGGNVAIDVARVSNRMGAKEGNMSQIFKFPKPQIINFFCEKRVKISVKKICVC